MPGNCDTRRSATYWMHRHRMHGRCICRESAGFWRALEQSWSSAEAEQHLLVLLLADFASQESNKKLAWQVCGATRQFFTCSN